MRNAMVLGVIVLACLSGCVASGDVVYSYEDGDIICDCEDCGDCPEVEVVPEPDPEPEPEPDPEFLDDGADGIGGSDPEPDPEPEPEPDVEICDGVDNDCDGEVDEGCEPIWCRVDQDGDWFGLHLFEWDGEDCPEGSREAIPSVDFNEEFWFTYDCDDTDPDVHPGAVDLLDGVDSDCDGEVDENAGD